MHELDCHFTSMYELTCVTLSIVTLRVYMNSLVRLYDYTIVHELTFDLYRSTRVHELILTPYEWV